MQQRLRLPRRLARSSPTRTRRIRFTEERAAEAAASVAVAAETG